jgi:hypothetical protein
MLVLMFSLIASVSTVTLRAGLDITASAKLHLNANPGTRARPVATLERARDAIRVLKQAGPLKESGVIAHGNNTTRLSETGRREPRCDRHCTPARHCGIKTGDAWNGL